MAPKTETDIENANDAIESEVTVMSLVTNETGHVVPVRVQVKLLRRLPAVCIVGLSASAVRETAERCRSAVEESGFEWPRCRVLVTIWDMPHRSVGQSGLDLAIAVAVLAASGQVPAPEKTRFFVGELALDGRLRSVRGLIGALQYAAVFNGDVSDLVIPHVEQAGCWAPGALSLESGSVWSCPNLREALNPTQRLEAQASTTFEETKWSLADLAQGSERSRHAIARTAAQALAFGHGIALTQTTPGCGSSSFAQRVSRFVGPTNDDRAVAEVQRIQSWAGLTHATALACQRPFRAPHYSVSIAGLLGGQGQPGEIHLAQHGVLYFAEVDAFRRSTLEAVASALRNCDSIQLVFNSQLSREELDAALPPAFMALFPVTIDVGRSGGMQGEWPSNEEMLNMIAAARGGT